MLRLEVTPLGLFFSYPYKKKALDLLIKSDIVIQLQTRERDVWKHLAYILFSDVTTRIKTR